MKYILGENCEDLEKYGDNKCRTCSKKINDKID